MLATVGTLVGFAGCSNGPADGDADDDDGSDPSETANDTATSGTASRGGTPELTLANIIADEEAVAGEPYEFDYVVENTGDGRGGYSTPVMARRDEQAEFEAITTVAVTVEPGESQRTTATVPAFESTGTVELWFGERENDWAVTVVAPETTDG